jgi:hypothetical protein
MEMHIFIKNMCNSLEICATKVFTWVFHTKCLQMNFHLAINKKNLLISIVTNLQLIHLKLLFYH